MNEREKAISDITVICHSYLMDPEDFELELTLEHWYRMAKLGISYNEWNELSDMVISHIQERNSQIPMWTRMMIDEHLNKN